MRRMRMREGEDMDHCASTQIQVYIIPSYSELLGGFLEDDTIVRTIPAGVSLSGDIDENSNREGWTSLVALIKERYAREVDQHTVLLKVTIGKAHTSTLLQLLSTILLVSPLMTIILCGEFIAR